MRWGWIYLGRVDYHRAMEIQQRHAARVLGGEAGPVLFLQEHPPTITLGRRARPENLLLAADEYRARSIDVVRVLRGGDVTVHAPGQLVGYPVAALGALKVSVPQWVQGHARALSRVLLEFGIESRWSDTHPGLWVGGQKIAAVGFQLSRGVSTHGFALNVDMDLGYFDTIVPCGLRNLGVTSMALQGARATLEELAEKVAREVAQVFSGHLPVRLPAEDFFCGDAKEAVAADASSRSECG